LFFEKEKVPCSVHVNNWIKIIDYSDIDNLLIKDSGGHILLHFYRHHGHIPGKKFTTMACDLEKMAKAIARLNGRQNIANVGGESGYII
jgi:hypothetical protein